jgi:magnesium transporter
MAEPQALTLAFLGDHPAEAARVIEALPVVDAAALFAQIPARAGAPALAAMLTTAAARVLGALGDEQVLALLTAAGTQSAVTLLRHVPEPRRTRLIGGLPTVAAMASRVLLGFPEDAVGAWSDPEVVALPPGTSAAHALQRVREGHEAGVERILVVDAERRLIGEVPLAVLLHAPDAGTVATLMMPSPTTLAAMMPVAAAIGLRAWERASTLPVVDREGRLVGDLHRAVLVRALSERTRHLQADTSASVTGLLAGGYWDVIAALVSAAVTTLPAVGRVLPEDE